MSAALLLLYSGCALTQPPQTAKTCNTKEPEDLLRFPQSITPYLVNVRERGAVTPLQRHYKDEYYSVWAADYRPQPLEKVQWPFDVYTPDNAYGENLRPLSASWFEAMRTEANWEDYDSVGQTAIALARLNLRNFPTQKPLFHAPCEAGEGFPFDYLQNSTVFANEPLYLSHYSKSGAWAYVLTSYATGWVPADRIALIGRTKRRFLESQPLLALLEDDMALHTVKGDYLFGGNVGMLLPLRDEGKKGYTADAVIEQGVRRARIVTMPLPPESAVPVPMVFSRANIARVITPILQTKYGWGGAFGDRDCSSTLRDIFAPFGLWLPRNSYQQSNVGRVVSLEGMSDREKLTAIEKQARPFETLLYLKGHILLYLGLYKGQPAVLHTFWGVKTVNGEGAFGRFVIGKTIISSLRLGHDIEGYRDENSLLHRIESMNFVFEPAQQGNAAP